MVSLIHQPHLLPGLIVDPRVNQDNPNYFRVSWNDNLFPKSSDSCANSACVRTNDECFCNVNIVDSQVYTSEPPSVEDVLSQLNIGAVDPNILGSYNLALNNGDMEIWHKNNAGYNQDTIFAVSYRGKKTFLKNMSSTIEIVGSSQFKFRNPPHFVNIAVREPRDAMYETDAVLETYFYQKGTDHEFL